MPVPGFLAAFCLRNFMWAQAALPKKENESGEYGAEVQDNFVLKKLTLYDSPHLTDASAQYLCRLRALKDLDVTTCEALGDPFLHALSSGTAEGAVALPLLEMLHLAENSNITDEGVRALGRLKSLHYVDVQNCEGLSSGIEELHDLDDLA